MSVGIKETKEALIAVNEIALHVARRFKDGVQGSDFIGFYNDFVNDADLKAKLQAGWDAHQSIPNEVVNIDLAEAIELATVEITYVPKIIAELIG